jgi:guanylate kinase
MRNVLIVLSGPSGVGKGTIAKLLIERNKQLSLSISCTTREPRSGEINGKEYFFISKSEFKKEIDNGGFLEYSEHFENFYGTPRDFVIDKLIYNDVLLEIDVNGGLKVKDSYNDAILIMVVPPSIEELRNRLILRGSESIEKIDLRMERMDYEIEKSSLYDYVVINDNLEQAVLEVEKIIENEKYKDIDVKGDRNDT